MKLKDITLKENEYLYIGYFSFKGNETFKGTSKGAVLQKVQGYAFNNLKNNKDLENLECVKVKDGYATKYASKFKEINT